MNAADAISTLQRAVEAAASGRPIELVIARYAPGGLRGSGVTEVAALQAGADWDAGRILVVPAKPLTELDADSVAAIRKSVAGGQSWHAYQAHKKLTERIRELEAEVASLRDAKPGA